MKPLLSGLRALWPDAEISVLLGPKFPRVYQEEPEVDRLWILEKRRILRNPVRLLLFIRALRRARFDLALDASHMHSFSLTGAALVWFSAAPIRVAYDREHADSFCNLLVEPLRAEHHEADILLNLLRPFTPELPDAPMRLHLTEEEVAAARDLRFGRIPGGEGVVVGLHVGGRGRKRWPLERWEALITAILGLYEVGIAVLCGPGEESEADRLREKLGERIAVFDDLDLREMMGLVGACDFFITPDTGPLHVAVALDVPTVAVFLEKTWVRYGPRGAAHRTVLVSPVNGEEKVLEAFAALVAGKYRDEPPPGEENDAPDGDGSGTDPEPQAGPS
jgi:ADP-heptose:LPS heptosyltransferase